VPSGNRPRWLTLQVALLSVSAAFAGSCMNERKAEHAPIHELEISMKYLLSKNQVGLAVSCALVMGFASGGSWAQTNPDDTAYLNDQHSTVVRSGTGLCWHTGFGPAALTPECDGSVPVSIAKADEPAPQPAATPTPMPIPVRERMTFDAGALFDFDKAELRPAGRLALDEFLGKMKRIEAEMITTDGHTDRFGSEGYNQDLSERRAQAVKTYLVSHGIDASRVRADGHGEMQPVTKAGECEGAKSAKVIACLQPDRRVEIEVAGVLISR